jgi:hypothetical protein
MLAGASYAGINNELGTQKQGAGFTNQPVTSIHDDLEANALYLADESSRILFVSCDLAGLETFLARDFALAMSKTCGVPPDSPSFLL